MARSNAPTGKDLDDLVLDFLSASLNSSLEWTAIAVARALDLYRGGDDFAPIMAVADSIHRLVRRGLVEHRSTADGSTYRLRIAVAR